MLGNDSWKLARGTLVFLALHFYTAGGIHGSPLSARSVNLPKLGSQFPGFNRGTNHVLRRNSGRCAHSNQHLCFFEASRYPQLRAAAPLKLFFNSSPIKPVEAPQSNSALASGSGNLTHECFSLPKLKWNPARMSPMLSEEAVEYHYGKHHAAYVRNLNASAKAYPDIAQMSLEELVRTSPDGPFFNNAAQHWNHSFFWECLTDEAQSLGSHTQLQDAINKDFGSFNQFKAEFKQAALSHFGSGWIWLVTNESGDLSIIEGHDASTPLRDGNGTPVLVLDVWEHAYYVNHRNDRGAYTEEWAKKINWAFASECYSRVVTRLRPV